MAASVVVVATAFDSEDAPVWAFVEVSATASGARLADGDDEERLRNFAANRGGARSPPSMIRPGAILII